MLAANAGLVRLGEVSSRGFLRDPGLEDGRPVRLQLERRGLGILPEQRDPGLLRKERRRGLHEHGRQLLARLLLTHAVHGVHQLGVR